MPFDHTIWQQSMLLMELFYTTFCFYFSILIICKVCWKQHGYDKVCHLSIYTYTHTYFPLFSCDFLWFFSGFLSCVSLFLYISMLFEIYFRHFRLPERSNKCQGFNPHNIFSSFFPETRFGGGVKSFEISSKLIGHFPYPPIVIILGRFFAWFHGIFHNLESKTGNRNC